MRISQRYGLETRQLWRPCSCISSLGARRLRFRRGGRLRLLQNAVAPDRFRQRLLALFSQFVIFARRALRRLRDRMLFPLRDDVTALLQTPQRRIDRPARQSRHIHNVEPVLIAVVERLQYHRYGEREIAFAHVPSYSGEVLYSAYMIFYIGWSMVTSRKSAGERFFSGANDPEKAVKNALALIARFTRRR